MMIEHAVLEICSRADKTPVNAGLTMWQMWQMPQASGLRGAPEVEKKFSARQ